MLLQQGVQLAIIVLRHHKIFETPDRIIKNLWFIILKYPCKNLLEALLTFSESKEFYEFLRLLYAKTVSFPPCSINIFYLQLILLIILDLF